MTPERLFHELLGLGLSWEVVESRFEREGGIVHLTICETPQFWDLVRCPKDTGPVFCYDRTEALTWRHLNVFQHRCEITCRLPRGKCRQCGHVFRVRPPWEGLSTHFTKEFEALALLLMREMPMSKVAGLVGGQRHPAVADALPPGGRRLCRGGFQQRVLCRGGRAECAQGPRISACSPTW